MNKKMSFILLLLCFGLLPSIAQAQDMSGFGAFIITLPTPILSLFSLIHILIFHRLNKKLTYLTPHSRLEILLIIAAIINYIMHLIIFTCFSFFLAEEHYYIALISTITFIIVSIIYFSVIKKNSHIQHPDCYRPPQYKPLKTTITTMILINVITSLLLLIIAFPNWLCFEFLFLFGGFLVPIQLVASFIFLKKEFKKNDTNPASPNTP